MDFLWLRIAAALAGAGAAAWQDARTSFIDDRVTGAMIALGAALSLYEVFGVLQRGAVLTSWLWVAAVALVIALLGFIAWRAGQFGGGDILLFLGIHLLLPFNPSAAARAALPYPFIVSVLVAASFFGAVWTALWYAHRLRGERAFDSRKNAFVLLVLVFSAGVFAWASFSVAQTIFFTALFASAFFLLVYKREIMRRVVVKRLPLRAVEDEDVLAVDELPKHLVAKYSIGRVLTRDEVAKLRAVERKEKIRLWPVCKELPRFAPFVLAGLIASLIAGDLVLFVLTH